MNVHFYPKDLSDFKSLADLAYKDRFERDVTNHQSLHYRIYVASLVDMTVKACDRQILNCKDSKIPSISKERFDLFCAKLDQIEPNKIPTETSELFNEWKQRIEHRFSNKELMRISLEDFYGKDFVQEALTQPLNISGKLYSGPNLAPFKRQFYFYHETNSEGGTLYWALHKLDFSQETRNDPDKLVTTVSVPNFARTKTIDYVVTMTRELFVDNLLLKIRHGLEPSNDANLDNMLSHTESVCGTLKHLDWQDKWRESKCILSTIPLTNEIETGPLPSDQYKLLQDIWDDLRR